MSQIPQLREWVESIGGNIIIGLDYKDRIYLYVNIQNPSLPYKYRQSTYVKSELEAWVVGCEWLLETLENENKKEND